MTKQAYQAPHSCSPVTDVPHTDISVLMNPGSENRQDMQGFDDDYVDIVDYIVRCTHKIWEERNLGLIYTHGAHNVLIHTSDGQTLERDKVIADSAKTMAAFPNIRLYADDVIWSGDAEMGFHTSPASLGRAQHGLQRVLPPTSRNIVRQGIAHCFVKANMIVEEWICRDELAMVLYSCHDPIELAKMILPPKLLMARNRPYLLVKTVYLRGQLPPERPTPQTPDDPEAFVRAMLEDVFWSAGTLDKFLTTTPHALVRACSWSPNPGRRQLSSARTGSFSHVSKPRLCCFLSVSRRRRKKWLPCGHVLVYERRHDGKMPNEASQQENLLPFGALAITKLRKCKIEREWMIYDVFAMLKQIYCSA